MCRVNHLRVCGSPVASKLPEQVLPDAAPRLAHKAIIDGCRRAILRRAIAPATAAFQYVQRWQVEDGKQHIDDQRIFKFSAIHNPHGHGRLTSFSDTLPSSSAIRLAQHLPTMIPLASFSLAISMMSAQLVSVRAASYHAFIHYADSNIGEIENQAKKTTRRVNRCSQRRLQRRARSKAVRRFLDSG